MEPQVQFARTSDDVGIAYRALGEGPVLVQMPLLPFSHIEMEWQNPEICRWVAHELFGWAEDDEAARFAEVMRHAVTQQDADRLIAATHDFDVEAALRDIEMPTLVVHRRQLRRLDMSLSRDLASRIPGARLVVVEGDSPFPAAGDTEPAAKALDEFLGRDAPSTPSGSSRRTVRIVLFTDLVGHTEIMSRLGDELGRRDLREHERLTREALREHGGSEVKTLGDGFLASFDGVTDAVGCAVALQRRFEVWNESDMAAELSPMSMRVGLNAGEPVEEDGDLFGATVILASRITDRAGGGEAWPPTRFGSCSSARVSPSGTGASSSRRASNTTCDSGRSARSFDPCLLAAVGAGVGSLAWRATRRTCAFRGRWRRRSLS